MGTKRATTTTTTTSATEVDVNLGLVIGELVAAPETRTLPSGTLAASFSLTVRARGVKTTSVPAVWYDPPKRVFKWEPGDRIVANGSIVRRFFQSAGGLGSATEVVVQHAELTRHQAKATRVVARVQTGVNDI